MGAGEILLNAIDNDGKGQGFDLNLVESVSAAVTIPVIASSGAGAPEHFTEVRLIVCGKCMAGFGATAASCCQSLPAAGVCWCCQAGCERAGLVRAGQ